MTTLNDPPCRFGVRFHRPAFYRYAVARPGFRLLRNTYASHDGYPAHDSNAWIGLALVAGRRAYCVKWADATVLPLEAR